MRARTLQQPLASLIVMGAKKLDAWPWPTSFRGLLAIHAASRLTPLGQAHALWPPIHKILAGAGLADPEALPLGEVVGVVTVTDAHRIRLGDQPVSDWERQLGDYKPGNWMVTFQDARIAPRPIPTTGQSGLWEWRMPADVAPWWEALG